MASLLETKEIRKSPYHFNQWTAKASGKLNLSFDSLQKKKKNRFNLIAN